MNTLPTIDIKGKQYVQVKDRILAFNETYKNGSIVTESLIKDGGLYVVKAKVTPDVKVPERYFTGHSQAKESNGMINATSALENAETSAVGRALAMMGIGIVDSVGSADELKKAGATTLDSFNKEDMNEPVVNCAMHHVPMKHYSKNGKDWYSHFDKVEGYCSGMGYKAKKQYVQSN